jgi:serine-type D-Ala-D-Ala carboxypeptidase/endopeptidase
MNSMMQKMALFILLVNSSITNETFAQASASEIQTFLDSEVTNKRTKGIVVGVIDANGTKIISAGKLSDKNTKKPDGNTMFEIASVTKLFTTLLLADFASKNIVSLSAPISSYLPREIKTPKFDDKEITLLQLASHTSGFPRFPFNQFPNKAVDSYTTDDLYYYISHFEPKVAFGSKFKYSNTGMGLLAHILSLQTRQSFDNLVSDNICRKLQLSNTTFTPSKKQSINVATGHLPYGNKTTHYAESECMKGSGGLYSSVNDLLKFVALGIGIDSNELYNAMQVTQAKVGNLGYELGYDAEILYDYGMGWNIWTKNGKTIHWKDGTSFGFRSFICFDKVQKKGVVILSNSFNPINDIGLHILDSTYKFQPYKYQWNLLDSIKTAIKQNGIKIALKKYHVLKISGNKILDFNEEVLDYLAKEQVVMKKYDNAIELLKLNISEYPKFIYGNGQ